MAFLRKMLASIIPYGWYNSPDSAKMSFEEYEKSKKIPRHNLNYSGVISYQKLL